MKVDRCPLTADEKKHMIAQEAYSRYQKRGASGGDAVGDWLEAEAEIEKHLNENCRSLPRKRGLAVDPRLGRMNRKVRDLGDAVPGLLVKVGRRAKQKVGATGVKISHGWNGLGVKPADFFKAWSGKGLYFLRHTSENFKEWMNRQRGKDN